MIDWAQLLEHYGYLAVAIGTFFEGETILLLGSYAVHHKILDFWTLILIGACGSFIGDMFYYYVGYHQGYKILKKRPKLEEKFHRGSRFIEKYPIITILLMRFLWGFRTILPASFGIKRFNLPVYIVANVIASFLWSFTIVALGVKISHYLHVLLHHMHVHAKTITIAVVATLALSLIIHLIVVLRRRKKIKNSHSDTPLD